jgi:lysophospholipase L1-like esterase
MKALQTAWSLVGLTLLLVLAAEGLGRLAYRWRDAIDRGRHPGPGVTAGARAIAGCVREGYAMKLHWQPYVYYMPSPTRGACVTVDSSGFRRTWRPAGIGRERGAPPGAAPVIALYGGSAMWGLGAPDDGTIPSLLARRLSADGIAARVENHAQIGWVSTQSLIQLELELRSNRVPRVVVFYDGVNDAFSCYQRCEAGIPANEFNREAEFGLVRDLPRVRRMALGDPSKTALGRFAAAIRRRLGREPAPPAWPASWTRAFGRDVSQRDVDSLAREVVRAYEGNARLVRDLGRARGFRPLFYWQPSVFTKAVLAEGERAAVEREQDLLRRFFLAVHEAVGRSAFLRDSVAFRNLDLTFAGDRGEIFFDCYHVPEAANARLAAAMYEDVRRVVGPASTPRTTGAR